MIDDIKLNVVPGLVTEIVENENSKRIIIGSISISYRNNDEIDQFIKSSFEPLAVLLDKKLYMIYDENNLLGLATQNGRVLLLPSSVNYSYIYEGLSINESYLHDIYRLNKIGFEALAKEAVLSKVKK